jgi:hypothetical protein
MMRATTPSTINSLSRSLPHFTPVCGVSGRSHVARCLSGGHWRWFALANQSMWIDEWFTQERAIKCPGRIADCRM